MEIKTSLWNILSAEGRLKNQWSKALAEADMAIRLSSLRVILKKLLSNPSDFVHLWMQFLDDFLVPPLTYQMTAADFSLLEEMGNTLSQPMSVVAPIRPVDIWLRVLRVYYQRNEERAARALMVRIYYAPSSSFPEKYHCVQELATRRAQGDDHISIYIDFLCRIQQPAAEQVILATLRSLSYADFNTDRTRLKRAAEVSKQLAASRIDPLFPHVWTVQGIYALQVTYTTSEAARYFYHGLQQNGRDKNAVIGLITCWVLLGAYNHIASFMDSNQSSVYAQDPLIAGLRTLSIAIQWLDSPSIVTPMPIEASTLEQLQALELSKYVGDLLTVTLGRVLLISGNARRAEELLRPFAGNTSAEPRWCYYAAWAEILTGKREEVATCLRVAGQWNGRWTIACLLLDTDQSLAEQYHVQSLLQTNPKAFEPYHDIISARYQLAHAQQPSEVHWQAGAGLLEEDLEALRTVLGHALFTRDTAKAEQFITHSLFMRLPLADQFFWRGLLKLFTRDHANAIAFLERSAIQLGYHRAARVLAVHFLAQNNIAYAKKYIEQATQGRTGKSVGLLHAYLVGREGNIDDAIKILNSLTVNGYSAAYYVSGHFLLQKTAQSSSNAINKVYRERAAQTLMVALRSGKNTLPLEAEAMAHAAQFVAYPEQGSDLYKTLWQDVRQLDTTKHSSWIKWNAVLAQLWYGDAAAVLAAERMICVIIDATDRISVITMETFAQALANVAIKVEDLDQAYRLIQMLERLFACSKLPSVKHICQQGITLALRTCYQQYDHQQRNRMRQTLMQYAHNDPTNASLTMLLAVANLENGVRRATITALRNSRGVGNAIQTLYPSIANLLEGQVESLPPLESGASATLRVGYSVLQLAVTLTSSKFDQAYQQIDALLQEEKVAATSLLDIASVLPMLCANLNKNNGASMRLEETIKKLAKHSPTGAQVITLARCATALGNISLALSLWEEALHTSDVADASEQEEYIKLLCYKVVMAQQQGKEQEVIDTLRRAASLQQKKVVQ